MIRKGIPRQRKLIFEGNSLMNHTTNSAAVNGFYVPSNIYNNVRSGLALSYSAYAVPGRSQTEINAAMPTVITPFVLKGDLIFLWEGTNDLYLTGDTGEICYLRLLTYAQAVRAQGCKIVVGTVIARDWAGNPPTYDPDPADLMDKVADYNQLIRDNSTEFDAIADFGADAVFNAKADASNTTYYNADKVHLTTAGQAIIITIGTTALTSVL